MAKRMEGNLNPDAGTDHSGRHDWKLSCDDYPVCVPSQDRSVEIVDGPATVTHNANVAYDPPPSHYAAEGMQPWDVIDAFGLDYYLGNVLKYILRAGRKDIAPRLDDLKKARNCLSRAIELEENR